jgi:hypothetical protein
MQLLERTTWAESENIAEGLISDNSTGDQAKGHLNKTFQGKSIRRGSKHGLLFFNEGIQGFGAPTVQE